MTHTHDGTDPGATGETDSFAIVAVGASAGGLEAFTQLLHSLPNDTGMAFVLIQHLDPKHHSALSELLAKQTGMTVAEAKNGTRVEPNHVYVIPPNVNMGIAQHRLRLTPRSGESGLHTPIDFFMRSLAEAGNSRSIGVVLSGTASDGTRGLAAIKAEGGITFAQDEKSAKYSGMPHSAAASGCVDFVLPPERIAQELSRVSGHPYLSASRTRATGTHDKRTSEDRGFSRIFAVLRKAGGVNFSQYKSGTIQRRTLRRMAIHKIQGVSEYAKYLDKHPDEVETLCQDLLIPVTSFFRDLEAFEALKAKVFPAVLKDKSAKGTIRIWDPGCSTGEETYSLAMVLLEFLGDRISNLEIQLFGTDANERGVEKARAGLYHERISHEMSPERLRRFFTKVDEGYRVSKTVRDLCVFARQNLAEDPPFSQMNMVACRNMLIYLGPELQRKVVPILHYALRPSGFLMLGSSESLSAFPGLFAPVDKKHKIFVKKLSIGRLHYDFSANRYPRETSVSAPSNPSPAAFDLQQQEDADQLVLKNYAPPGLIVNEILEILQFRGAVGPYVEPASGKASLQLSKIARRELAAELRSAVNQAKKHHAPVKRKAVEFSRNGQIKAVDISVEPLGPSSESGQYLILFEKAAPPLSLPARIAGKSRSGLGRAAKGEIAKLRRRLSAAEEHLHSLAESKEASDEEYQSANEEILSANEELQSTNEELETSKEELQSANEELNTVNDELHSRNVELDRTNNDLNNLLSSTTLPVVMVDRGLCIRRATAAAAKYFNILPSDMGRRISDIRPDINVPDWEILIAGVIDTLAPKEMEVQDKQNHWYSLQMRPYRTLDDKIDGAILILSDIDLAKQASERMRKSKEFLEDIVDTVRQPLLVLDSSVKVLYANPAFLKTFGANREETNGNSLYRLQNGRWNTAKLREALEQVISTGTAVQDFGVEAEFPPLGAKRMLLNARRIEDGRDDRPMMLLAIEDITERKRKEENTLQLAYNKLQEHADELGRFNRAAVGRELRMIELKKEINELCQSQGETPRYSLESGPDQAEHSESE